MYGGARPEQKPGGLVLGIVVNDARREEEVEEEEVDCLTAVYS